MLSFYIPSWFLPDAWPPARRIGFVLLVLGVASPIFLLCGVIFEVLFPYESPSRLAVLLIAGIALGGANVLLGTLPTLVAGAHGALTPERNRGEPIHASDDLVNLIDDWRRKQPDLPSRAEAVRRLVEIALKGS